MSSNINYCKNSFVKADAFFVNNTNVTYLLFTSVFQSSRFIRSTSNFIQSFKNVSFHNYSIYNMNKCFKILLTCRSYYRRLE